MWCQPRTPSSNRIPTAHQRRSLFAGLPTLHLKVPYKTRGPYTGSARRGLRRLGSFSGPLACS